MKNIIFKLKVWLFELPRPQKRILSVFADCCFIVAALWAAFALRYEKPNWLPSVELLPVFFITISATVVAFVRLGLYRAIIRYISEKALMVMIAGVLISALSLIVSGFLLQVMVPRSVPVIYGALLFILVAGTRFGFRALINQPGERGKVRVLIVGTGSRALQLFHSLKQGTEYRPMGFVSIDPKKFKTLIAGLQVYSLDQIHKAASEQGIRRVFLALEDSSSIRRRDIINRLESINVAVQTIPAMTELVAGQARINDIRDLDLVDLLGRDPVYSDPAVVAESLKGKSVLVSGAGGSIGSELCRQIIANHPSRIVLFEQSEYALYKIEKELCSLNSIKNLGVEIQPILGSVLHRSRIEIVIHTFAVKVVYHAAAYKHVPLVEHNLIEGIQNNVFGTWHLAEAAIDAGVERFVLISTDKAVRPTNIMGASKRLAELVLQGLAQRQESTLFSMVRFGNVLDSSGSVVPLFRDQIRNGGPVTVTHPDIVRYFMTIPEASQLVLQAGAMGRNGEVFVLDMGEPIKIVELAQKLIRLMGLTVKNTENPSGDIAIVYTGLRPGEKLYEELLIGDDPQGTAHPRIMMAREISMPWSEIARLLEALISALGRFDCKKVVELIRCAPIGYQPQGEIEDPLWCLTGDTPVGIGQDSAKDNAAKVVQLPTHRE